MCIIRYSGLILRYRQIMSTRNAYKGSYHEIRWIIAFDSFTLLLIYLKSVKQTVRYYLFFKKYYCEIIHKEKGS